MKTLLIVVSIFAIARIAAAEDHKPLNVNTKGLTVVAETFEIECACKGNFMVCTDVVLSGLNKGATKDYITPSAFCEAANVR